MNPYPYISQLFALMLFFLPLAHVSAQAQSWQITGLSIPALRQQALAMPSISLRSTYKNKLWPEGIKTTDTPATMPSVYCFDDLAFFCKIEVQLEKKLRFPVKFRLGDVPYVDWMEGKRRTY